MKLVIKRESSSSLMGKASYALHVRADLQGDEEAVIKKNKLGKELLVYHEKTGDASSLTGAIYKRMRDTALTVESLVKGTTFTCANVAELIGIEDEVREASVRLRTIIEMARTFGGEEVVNVDEEFAKQFAK